MAKKRKATLSSKLKALQKSWKRATPKQGGVGVPDGTYDIRIESAILEEAKSTGRLQIHWILTVLTEEYANKALHKYDGCDRAEDLDWVQGTLETLELEIPDNIANIGPTLEEAQGLLAEITVQTRDEFTNILCQDLLADQDEEEEEEEEGEEEAEEEEEEEEELEVGSRVSAEFDDETFEGEITSINTKKGTADVDFDDETSDTVALDELTALESEDEEEEEGEEEAEEEEEEEGEGEEYDEDDVKAMNLKELAELIEEEDLKIKTKNVKIGPLRKAVIKKLF